MGFELAAALIGPTLIGWWVDQWQASTPKWTLVGAGLGFVGGFYNFIREAWQLSREQQAAERKQRREHDRRED